MLPPLPMLLVIMQAPVCDTQLSNSEQLSLLFATIISGYCWA
jgi:hypothetical protein